MFALWNVVEVWSLEGAASPLQPGEKRVFISSISGFGKESTGGDSIKFILPFISHSGLLWRGRMNPSFLVGRFSVQRQNITGSRKLGRIVQAGYRDKCRRTKPDRSTGKQSKRVLWFELVVMSCCAHHGEVVFVA